MPFYDYRCLKCGETRTVQKSMADPDPKFHLALFDMTAEGYPDTVCNGELEQVLSVATIKFKGRGWYVTDYGKGK